jgi:hypothetical protein
VEVKKKRGDLAKRRSIWGDLDLTALETESSGIPKDAREPVGNECDVEPVAAVACGENTGSAIATTADDGDTSAVADASHAPQDSTAVQTEGNIESPARSFRKRVRRREEPTLPRGQRWKRRLPKALRR